MARPWKPTAESPADYPFTLIDLRLNRIGGGEGKTSLGAKVSGDQEDKKITLENYTSAPALIKGVKRDRTPL
jgi:hypothetical protein